MCCFLLRKNTNYSTSDLMEAGIESVCIAIWAILFELNAFLASMSIPMVSGIKDVKAIVEHVVERGLIARFYGNNTGVSLSPMWLINNLMFTQQQSYINGMYMMIVVVLIGIILQ